MNNDKALDFFAKFAKYNGAVPSFHAKNMRIEYDVEMILRYADSATILCDLASGPGVTVSRVADSVKRAVAVEPFKEYTDQIPCKDNLQIVNATIENFESHELFDLITFFGIAHYFNTEEIIPIYKKCFRLLKDRGKLIVKNQFGTENDVVVDNFSQEIGANYCSEYRHLPKEVSLLTSVGFVDIDVIDIYPPECNPWSNTHYYALVARHP